MKKSIVILLLLVGPAASAQQADSLYLVTYSLGPLWDPARNPQEQTYFAEHSAHLSKLRKDKIITMGARYSDKGIIILRLPSMKEAEDLINQDPAIQNKLFSVTIDPLFVFYEGLVERPKADH